MDSDKLFDENDKLLDFLSSKEKIEELKSKQDPIFKNKQNKKYF